MKLFSVQIGSTTNMKPKAKLAIGCHLFTLIMIGLYLFLTSAAAMDIVLFVAAYWILTYISAPLIYSKLQLTTITKSVKNYAMIGVLVNIFMIFIVMAWCGISDEIMALIKTLHMIDSDLNAESLKVIRGALVSLVELNSLGLVTSASIIFVCFMVNNYLFIRFGNALTMPRPS